MNGNIKLIHTLCIILIPHLLKLVYFVTLTTNIEPNSLKLTDLFLGELYDKEFRRQLSSYLLHFIHLYTMKASQYS